MKNIKFIIFLFLLLAFISNDMQAQNETSLKSFKAEQLNEIISSDTRFVVSLSGKWRRVYEDGESGAVELPSSEKQQRKVTYERTLKISKDIINSSTFQLYFFGFEDEIEIYLNGQFVGRYFGGMTPFSIRIPSKMIIGETNNIKLVVEPAQNYSKQIKTNSVFSKKVFTGIIRDILLIGTPNIWTSSIKYNSQLSGDLSMAKLGVSANISSSNIKNVKNKLDSGLNTNAALVKYNVDIQALLVDTKTGIAVTQSEIQSLSVENERTNELKFGLSLANPLLWSPENPNLYKLKIKISKNGMTIDEYSQNVGFRDIKVANVNNVNSILLNGEIYEMKGIAYVEDAGESGGTVNPKKMEEDVLQIKELGANTVRYLYNVPHPYFVSLCDKYGLLVMAELPTYDTPDKILISDEIVVRMKNIAERSINQFENNPSLFAFGLYSGVNEGSKAADKYTKAILQKFHNSSKLIYKIINLTASKINSEGFDFIGLKNNTLESDFEKIKKKITAIQEIVKNKPIFFNYGVAIEPENRNGYSDDLSVEYQAFYIRNIFHIIKSKDLLGGVVMTYNDYMLEHPLLVTNFEDQYLASMGLLDRNRQTRLAFQTLQTLYNMEKEPILNAGSYTKQTPVSYIIIGLGLIIVLVFLFNRFRRFREYVTRSVLRPFNFYADIRDQRIMSSIQTIVLGLIIGVTLGIFFASLLYYFRSSQVAQYFLMLFFPVAKFQEGLYKVIWMPLPLMLAMTIIFIGIKLLIAFILRVFAFFVRGRIYFSDTITITIWAGVPLLLLLPISIILVRILSLSSELIWLIFAFVIFIVMWVFARILKATSVVFDKASFYVYGIGIIFMTLAIGFPIAMYQYKYAFFDYAQFVINIMLGW